MTAKGISIKFKSYGESIKKVLDLIKLNSELKNHESIVIKPWLNGEEHNTKKDIIEEIIKYCLAHKKNDAEIVIAEGVEGKNTIEIFENLGYKELAEKYGVGLVDLNTSEIEEIFNGEFIKFDYIKYPRLLKNSFIISVPELSVDDEMGMVGSISNMVGAFPSRYYSGFFSSYKNKIRKWPIKYSIHDIVRCKMPSLAIIDASKKGYLIVGKPLEMDVQASKILELDKVGYLKLFEEEIQDNSDKKE